MEQRWNRTRIVLTVGAAAIWLFLGWGRSTTLGGAGDQPATQEDLMMMLERVRALQRRTSAIDRQTQRIRQSIGDGGYQTQPSLSRKKRFSGLSPTFLRELEQKRSSQPAKSAPPPKRPRQPAKQKRAAIKTPSPQKTLNRAASVPSSPPTPPSPSPSPVMVNHPKDLIEEAYLDSRRER